MAVDKNQAVIDFISTCPKIANNPLFFNFINAKDENKQIITVSNDTIIDKPYIDGSVMKRYTFTLVDFKSISYNPIVKLQQGTSTSTSTSTSTPSYANENVEEILDTQDIIDWIREQADLNNFPNFGDDCYVDEMVVANNSPTLKGIDTTTSPPLAQYGVTIYINYIDNSKKLWR